MCLRATTGSVGAAVGAHAETRAATAAAGATGRLVNLGLGAEFETVAGCAAAGFFAVAAACSRPVARQPAAKAIAAHQDDDGPQWSSSKKADSDSKDGEDDATDAKSKGKKSAKNAAADDDDESADASAKPKTAKPGVLAPESDPSWDPFHAAQDMDVGKFYMDKGDWDAAITRFEDAIRLRANFAKPREMMAEAYEKKGDKQEAVRYYKEYLQVLPNAPDAKKIQKKIEQLSAK